MATFFQQAKRQASSATHSDTMKIRPAVKALDQMLKGFHGRLEQRFQMEQGYSAGLRI